MTIKIEYDRYLERYTCHDTRYNWIAFTGYGDTKEKAEIDMHASFANVTKPTGHYLFDGN